MKDRPEIPIIQDIRLLLKDYYFNNISLGRIYRTQFILEYWDGRYTYNSYNYIFIFFIRFYLLIKLFINKFPQHKRNTTIENSLLLETMSTEARLRGFWHPILLKSNESYKKTVLLNCPNLEKYTDKLQDVIISRTLKGNPFKILKWHILNRKSIQNKINNVCLKYNLNKKSSSTIYNTILASIILIEQYDKLFKDEKPSCFIAIDDQHVHSAIVCNILNRYNIPTYTHIHGAIGEQSMVDFIPINAKYVLCWGNYMKQLFLNKGVHESKLIVTGCQRSKPPLVLTTERIVDLKKRLGLKENSINKRIILFGFTRIITTNWIEDLKLLISDLDKGFQLIGRLHPSTTSSDAQKIRKILGDEIIITESEDISLEEQISISEYIVIDSSTLGFDAMIQEKIVIVLDSAKELKTQDVMFDALKTNSVMLCRSPSEVIQFIHSKEKQLELKLNASAFVKQYLAFWGDEAASNIMKQVV